MAVPNPKYWVPGDLPTATTLNTEFRSPVTFMVTRPSYWATLSADVAIGTGGSWSDVSWSAVGTDLRDGDNMHAGTSVNIIIVTAGLYDIRAQALWAANTTGVRGLRIWSNTLADMMIASGVYSSTGAPDGSAVTGITQDTSQEVSVLKYLDVGHSFKMQVWQNSGGNLNLMGDLAAANVETYIAVRWMASS